eukprot:14036895-Heterocapsa_arctica.AAC.1
MAEQQAKVPAALVGRHQLDSSGGAGGVVVATSNQNIGIVGIRQNRELHATGEANDCSLSTLLSGGIMS